MKRLLPVAVAAVILAAVGLFFWLSDGGPIPSAMPSDAPAVGSCWSVAPTAIAAPLPWPGHALACSGSHNAEIFYRGQVDHALLKQYRAAKGQAAQAAAVYMDSEARAGCTGNVGDYLGGTWRSAQLTVVPDFLAPEKDGFYACVVAQVSDPGGAQVIGRTGMLASALSGPDATSLGIDCFTGAGSAASFTPCTQSHTGEFVGLYIVTPLGAKFNGPELQTAVTTGCQNLLNSFLTLPAGAADRTDLVSSYVGPTSAATWLGSDQTFACYTYASSPMTGSVKGLGTRPLPR